MNNDDLYNLLDEIYLIVTTRSFQAYCCLVWNVRPASLRLPACEMHLLLPQI